MRVGVEEGLGVHGPGFGGEGEDDPSCKSKIQGAGRQGLRSGDGGGSWGVAGTE